jgi:cytochrome c553
MKTGNETTSASAGLPVCSPRFCRAFHRPSNIQHDKYFMKRIVIIACAAFALSSIAALAVDAKENWEKTCAKCHGPDGKGETKMGQKLAIKNLTDAKLQTELKDDQAFKSIKEGIKDSEGKVKMKPAEGLTDDDIKALVAHVRTLKK